MNNDIKQWIITCIKCQLVMSGKTTTEPLHHLTPWILIAIDYTTDWPLARVAQNAIHEVVTKFLNDDIVLNFGCPTEIITDRGNNFTINISNSYFKLIGIKYILISAYHSWSSGVIERFNHLFDSMIAKYVADNTINKWDQYVDRALFVCRIR
ncbi:unnamed protein product [Rotaria sordida]|uniref:Integrase catalytic domain-containing protein n=1 Tax=Rotaria sordida TaxID=392033 RepID=A0A814XMX2_9BILA|nr:unnamed protein product [Rotaria sordida]CAF1476112.1 unnamed protein product [Rotaria sordida]CAF3853428.1 unnamed protein product [Rotaria sordida]CAF3961392.1 unnamed protein product [Rotaria sordida]